MICDPGGTVSCSARLKLSKEIEREQQETDDEDGGDDQSPPELPSLMDASGCVAFIYLLHRYATFETMSSNTAGG